MGRNVSVGLMAMFDVFSAAHLHRDNTIIGYNVTVLTHEFWCGSTTKGRLRLEQEVLIGSNSTILPGVRIGDELLWSRFPGQRDIPGGSGGWVFARSGIGKWAPDVPSRWGCRGRFPEMNGNKLST